MWCSAALDYPTDIQDRWGLQIRCETCKIMVSYKWIANRNSDQIRNEDGNIID